MRYNLLFIITLLLSLVSCRKDFDTVRSSGQLQFSKTTVYLDTVFTNIGSSTYMLKVYNKSSNDITIPSIALAKGTASKYRLMVDGLTGLDADNSGFGDGKIFQNVELLAKDSLFVFIETTANNADVNPSDMLYTDEILFDAGAFQQKVNLVTLVQDAVFLYPERFDNGNGGYTYEGLQIGTDPPKSIYGFLLNDVDPINGNELIFTNAKPYVIYGYAAVPPGKVLEIQAGARVYFHDQSGIIVANTGSIQVNGGISTDPIALENEVVFEGDRLEPRFAETPGQWGTIWLTDGSTNNSFNHLTIKNASAGFLIENQDATTVQIKNTQIYNVSNNGIIAKNAKINGENIVVNNAGQTALACVLGGNYTFNHCTFANYWTGGSRQTPTVFLDNTLKVDETLTLKENLTATFTNSIIYGSNNIELILNKDDSADFDCTVDYCLVKFNDNNNQFLNNPLYAFLNSANNIIGNNLNPNDPLFKDASKNNLRIKFNSPAKSKGNPTFIITPDADGKPRTTPPDLGAYQHLPN
ncbi:hypothetical protein [Flavobacterium sp.]|uniref:hypothetical protein n=1 Tax=Flavobacterium sp. TaxID=239 RepID=UPI00286E87FC|nr:hypothetical protein [Flavobacterium sp.]